MKIPFGKFKGENIEDVPLDYLAWCIENMDLDQEIEEAFEKELKNRMPVMPFGKYQNWTLDEIPVHYLKYALRNFDLKDYLVKAIEEQIENGNDEDL